MTDTEKVRLLIGDPAGVSQHFSDAELQVFLDLAGNSIFLAAAYALKAWASALSELVDSERIGDYGYTKKQVDNKLKLAENYEKQAASTPAMAIASFNFTGVKAE